MDIIGQAEVREAHVARGEAECYMMRHSTPPHCCEGESIRNLE